MVTLFLYFAMLFGNTTANSGNYTVVTYGGQQDSNGDWPIDIGYVYNYE